MKTKQINPIFYLCLLFASVFAVPLEAQITFSQLNLTIDGLPSFGRKAFRVNDFGGLYWTFDDTTKFFQIDITPQHPRLAGTGETIKLYNTDKLLYNSIEVASIYNHSDARAKTNVQDMKGALSTILNLRPVTYNWLKPSDEDIAAISSADSSVTSIHSYSPEENLQYGFLAQEVEKIIPDIVRTSDTGDKLINYTALIPMLVESIQELHEILNQQNVTIESLSGQLGTYTIQSHDTKNRLISCTPNPTSGFVTIETQLEDNVKEAGIIITSMAGNREKLLTVSANETTATTDVSAFSAGIHIVSLYIDGKLADSCRLIKQ